MLNIISELLAPSITSIEEHLNEAKTTLEVKREQYELACFNAHAGDAQALKIKSQAENVLNEASKRVIELQATLNVAISNQTNADIKHELNEQAKLKLKLNKLADRLSATATKVDIAAQTLGASMQDIADISDELGSLAPINSIELDTLFKHLMSKHSLPCGLAWHDPVNPRPDLELKLKEAAQGIKSSIN